MFHIFCSESISISLSRADNFFKIIWFYFTCSHVLTFTLTCHAKCLFIFIFILFIYILLLLLLFFFIFYFLFESFYLYSLALMTEPFCILVLRYTINSYKTRNERQGIKTTNFFFFFLSLTHHVLINNSDHFLFIILILFHTSKSKIKTQKSCQVWWSEEKSILLMCNACLIVTNLIQNLRCLWID